MIRILVICLILYTHKFDAIPTHSVIPNFVTITGNDFIKDGQPYRIISGIIHYWGSLPQYWKDRLTLIKELGCNTITTYIWWGLHEPEDGVFVFNKAEYDFVAFIELAHSLDLLVIVRVGPYITAEVDFGGFPYWIMKKQGIALRRPNKMYYELIPRLVPLQYHLGGNTINFQIEDDSDVPIISFNKTHQYYEYLRDGLIQRGIKTLINTLAWPDSLSLQKAIIPNTWTTLEYTIHHLTPDALSILRKYASDKNPFMVMEYYPAWMDYEEKPHQILDLFDGTNFQFKNGSDWALVYHSITTSYDT